MATKKKPEPVLEEITVKEIITNTLMETKREGMEDLLEVMEENGFFTAPASSGGGRHNSEEGGLAEHSLNVYKTAVSLTKALMGPISRNSKNFQNSLAIVCLLHDLGKMGDHGKKAYVPNILKSTGKPSDSKPWVRNKDLTNIPHSTRSVLIAERWIDLTEDEEYAILYHDGLYDRETGGMAVIQGHETKLLLILHWADLWSARVIEAPKDEESEGENNGKKNTLH